MTESAARLRQPVLRPPEKHQLGYNNILLPYQQAVAADAIANAATLLKLSHENIKAIMSESVPLPVARTTTRQEAELVTDRLRDVGLSCLTLGDDELGLSFSDGALKRVRAMSFTDDFVTIHQAGAGEQTEVSWAEIPLILTGRLFETRLEIKERKTRKTENEILDTSEFFRDEAVIHFYTAAPSSTWRVVATGFDFSCLENEKALIASENIGRLQRLIAARSVNAEVDNSYQRVRQLLELAWGAQQETQSSGWRRERPGKLSVGVAMVKSNEDQFTRYSRLRYYFKLNPENRRS